MLPRSRRWCRAVSSRRLSRGCRPMVGSSSTYSTPVRPLPIWLARRMRCDSPPDSVGAGRRQRQVIEADIDQELQAVADLAQQFAGHLLLGRRQLQRLEQSERFAERQGAQFARRQGRAVGPEGRRQAAASSRSREPRQVRAGDLADQVVEPLAVGGADARRLVDGREQSLVLEADAVAVSVASFLVAARVERDPRLAGAVQDGVLLGRRQLLERRVQREAGVPRQRLGEAQEGAGFASGRARRPGRRRAASGADRG